MNTYRNFKSTKRHVNITEMSSQCFRDMYMTSHLVTFKLCKVFLSKIIVASIPTLRQWRIYGTAREKENAERDDGYIYVGGRSLGTIWAFKNNGGCLKKAKRNKTGRG